MNTINEIKLKEKITDADIVRSIYVKNHILSFSNEKLLDAYGLDERYLYFLDSIVVISKIDYGFFLIDDNIIERIRMIVNSKRNDYHEPHVVECINSIIIMCNHIDSIEPAGKNLLISQYISYQSDARCLDIISKKHMLSLFINDALVYDAILKNNWDNVKSEGFLLGSLLYLTYNVPELFSDEKNRSVALEKIYSIRNKKGFFRKDIKEYAKVVSDCIDILNEKEE